MPGGRIAIEGEVRGKTPKEKLEKIYITI